MLNILKTLRDVIVNKIEKKAVRGYFDLKKNNPDLIHEVKEKIANIKPKNNSNLIQNVIFPKNLDIHLTYHQFIVNRLLGMMFTRVLLYFIRVDKKIIYPLPFSWIKIIENSGLRVSMFWSTCFFCIFILFSGFVGLITLMRHAIKNHKRRTIQDYSYFFNLNKKCFPLSRNQNSYDIMSWFLRVYKSSNNKDKLLVYHSTPGVEESTLDGHKIAFAPEFFPKISFVNFWLKFIPVSVCVIVFVLLTLRWKNIILLSEIIDMYAIKFADNNQLAKDYFFSYSHLVYRPMWTYYAEKKGSNLIVYFYACNISTYQEKDKNYSTIPEFFQLINWPRCLVWNQSHADYIKAQLSYNSIIDVIGPIGFEDNSMSIPEITRPSILIFDIQPLRMGFGIPALSCAQWYAHDYKVAVEFFNDIHDVCLELGLDLYYKRKRNSPLIHKRYKAFLKKFEKKDNVFEVNPGISAFRLCKNFDIVLSMPFTSTAVIGDYFGKYSVYYDPTGKIQKKDRAAHNLQVISQKNELRSYLQKKYNFLHNHKI